MPKLLIHPGFHKTGTSSAQHLLWKNRSALLPHVQIYQIRHLKEAGKLALAYSKSHDPMDLVDLAPALDAAFHEIGPKEGRHILISHEGLAGHLPGWPGVETYAALPTLVALYCTYFQETFPNHDIEVVLTTRDAESWLHSTWRHHLRGQRLTQDWDSFREAFGPAADLGQVATDLRDAIAPVPVVTADLAETTTLPLGPGEALLTRLGLPRSVIDVLNPVGAGNKGPEEALAAQFLSLNRCALPDDEVAAQKDRLAVAAGVGGWQR